MHKGGGRPLASQPPTLHALRVQTSAYGQPIPIVYGTDRVPGKLIWYGDFTAVAHTSQQATGGKGGGGGGTTTTTTYTYTAACIVLLCEGPIYGLQNVWDTKGKLSLTRTSEQFTVPGGGGVFAVSQQGAHFYDHDGVSRADAYSQVVNDYGAGGNKTLAGTQNTPLVLTGGAPAAGQYSHDGTGNFTFAAGDAGKTVTVTYTYAVPDGNSNGVPSGKLNVTLFKGVRPQTAWTYMTSRHSAQALGYSGVAYVANGAFDCGASGTLPNYSWEVATTFRFGGGVIDAAPKAIVYDLLTNVFYGLGLNPAIMGDLTQFDNYCTANGIFLSATLQEQRPAAEWLKDLLEICNTAAVWSEGVLKLVPYGDTSAIGNGAQFTPNTAPVYDLTDSDFMAADGSDPVQISRPSAVDMENSVSVEFLNRANNYNPEILEEKDDAAISVYGLRKAAPKQWHPIKTQAVAALVATTLLKRKVYIRTTYKFRLGLQYSLLEPMDLVTLTDTYLGLNKTPVRIVTIQEDADGYLQVEAEEFPFGTAAPTQYPKETAGGYVSQADADPGMVNAPYVFEANNRLTGGHGYQIWIGASGASPDWGGCSVWASNDGTAFKRVGTINGPARMGALTASLASHADPDTVNTMSVDLTESFGVISGASTADADAFKSLFLVDAELVGYRDAALTANYKYDLTTLHRGVYGTTPAAHAPGAPCIRLDQALLALGFKTEDIGKTIHLKFTSFNTRGLNEQSQANVVDYPFTIVGTFKGAIAEDSSLVLSTAIDGSSLNDQGSVVPVTSTSAPFTYASGDGGGADPLPNAHVAWVAQTIYRTNQTQLAVPASTADALPAAPTTSTVAGGAKGARSNFCRVAYVKNGLLRGISNQTTQVMAGSDLVKITSPAAPAFACDGWVPMVSTITNQNVVQIDPATPVAFGTDWTEPTSAIRNDIAFATYGFQTGAMWAYGTAYSTTKRLYPYWPPKAAVPVVEFANGLNPSTYDPAIARQMYTDGNYALSSSTGFTIATGISGGSGSGGGGGCVLSRRTKVWPLVNDAHGVACENEDWITVWTEDGGHITGTPDHRVRIRGRWAKLGDLKLGDEMARFGTGREKLKIEGQRIKGVGYSRVFIIAERKFKAEKEMVFMPGDCHLFWAASVDDAGYYLNHNLKP